jgi:hypothetical protein
LDVGWLALKPHPALIVTLTNGFETTTLFHSLWARVDLLSAVLGLNVVILSKLVLIREHLSAGVDLIEVINTLEVGCLFVPPIVDEWVLAFGAAAYFTLVSVGVCASGLGHAEAAAAGVGADLPVPDVVRRVTGDARAECGAVKTSAVAWLILVFLTCLD